MKKVIKFKWGAEAMQVPLDDDTDNFIEFLEKYNLEWECGRDKTLVIDNAGHRQTAYSGNWIMVTDKKEFQNCYGTYEVSLEPIEFFVYSDAIFKELYKEYL